MKKEDIERKIKEEELRKKKAEADKAEQEVETEKAKERKTNAEAKEKKRSNLTKISIAIISGLFGMGGIAFKAYLSKKTSGDKK